MRDHPEGEGASGHRGQQDRSRLVRAYGETDGDERAWWHQANALWLAAREHVRRHSLGDRLSKRAGSEPSPDRLTELHVEYALEASAVLSLQQAADGYCKARPSAV